MAYVHIENVNQWWIVQFRADRMTDPGTVQNIADELSQALQDLPYQGQVILNFKGVTAVSSQVIGILIRIRETVLNKKGRLVLAELSDSFIKLLKLTKLDRQFTFSNDVRKLVGEKSNHRSAVTVGGSKEIDWMN